MCPNSIQSIFPHIENNSSTSRKIPSPTHITKKKKSYPRTPPTDLSLNHHADGSVEQRAAVIPAAIKREIKKHERESERGAGENLSDPGDPNYARRLLCGGRKRIYIAISVLHAAALSAKVSFAVGFGTRAGERVWARRVE